MVDVIAELGPEESCEFISTVRVRIRIKHRIKRGTEKHCCAAEINVPWKMSLMAYRSS